jgi:hypothetical protein
MIDIGDNENEIDLFSIGVELVDRILSNTDEDVFVEFLILIDGIINEDSFITEVSTSIKSSK